MINNLMEYYTDYILSSFGQVTATGLSKMTDNKFSHDQVSRFLNSSKLSSKNIWEVTKPFYKKYTIKSKESEVLIVDDSVVEKPYSQENDLVNWHYDHCSGKTVKGMNLLSLLHSTSTFDLPVGYEIVKKDKLVKVKNKLKRKSSVGKNEVFRNLVDKAIDNNISFKYILGDSWFGSKKNMEHIAKKDKSFVFALKSNRLVSIKIDGKFTDGQAISEIDLQEGIVYNALLNGMDTPVCLAKQVFKNGNSVCGILYLVTNDLKLDYSSLIKLYQRRWKIEEYHKSLKSNLGLSKSPTAVPTTQANHFFLCILSFVKLEIISVKSKTNHFAMKSKIYLEAIKACYAKIQKINQNLDLLKLST
ncbi:MAG: IS701 family transposase [Candidatus Cloacimonadota bacterium]|nr:MAG: IS701 family transposase [Candidatus Cloacimonadota bacterium]